MINKEWLFKAFDSQYFTFEGKLWNYGLLRGFATLEPYQADKLFKEIDAPNLKEKLEEFYFN